MKIVGGTFGTAGGAHISKDGYLVVSGAKQEIYKPDDLTSLDTQISSEKRMSVVSLLLGILLVVLPLTIFFNVFGFLIGLVLTWFGSRYTNKDNVVDLVFGDGEKVSLVCTPRQVNKLVDFKG